MSADTFIDTNVLVRVYDFGQPEKRNAAIARLRSTEATGSPTVSTNVLGELYSALTRPYRATDGSRQEPLLNPDAAAAAVRQASNYRVVTTSRAALLEALRLRGDYQLHWWDAIHLACAKEHGCTRLLTEDVPSAGVIEGVTYEDPFAA